VNEAQLAAHSQVAGGGLSRPDVRLLTMWVLRSAPMASGTAAATVVALIALKHLGLLVAVGSPFTALLQLARPRLFARCGRPPDAD
jgi:hypothetical protein